MPYVLPAQRQKLDRGQIPDDAGDLNYRITNICLQYLNNKGEKYATYNDIMGALEGAKLEMYRRRIAPYEDIKCRTNGDVY